MPSEERVIPEAGGKEMIDTKRMIDAKDTRSRSDGKTLLYLDGRDNPQWSFFAAGTGAFTSRRAEIATGGVTVGIDRRLNDHLILGAAVTYANTSFDLAAGGDVGIDSFLGSLYGLYYDRGFYLDGIFGAGYHSYETRRATPSGFGKGDTDGRSLHGLLGAGYDWYVGGFIIGPVASLRYTEVETDEFLETDTLTPIRVTSGSRDALQSTLGARVARPFQLGRVVFSPEVRVQWAHEYLDNNGILNTGEPFTPLRTSVGSDSLLLDVGTWIHFSPRLSFFGYYRADVGRNDYYSHAVNGGFQISF